MMLKTLHWRYNDHGSVSNHQPHDCLLNRLLYADQRKHRDRWIPRTKGQLRGKCFHLMTSSWLVSTTYTTAVTHKSSRQHCWFQISPREPHALAKLLRYKNLSGLASKTENQKKKCRFLVNFASTDSLRNLVLIMVRFASIRSWQILEFLTFPSSRWRMPPGLLWFGHVNGIGLCSVDRKEIGKIVFRPNFLEIGPLFGLVPVGRLFPWMICSSRIDADYKSISATKITSSEPDKQWPGNKFAKLTYWTSSSKQIYPPQHMIMWHSQ